MCLSRSALASKLSETSRFPPPLLEGVEGEAALQLPPDSSETPMLTPRGDPDAHGSAESSGLEEDEPELPPSSGTCDTKFWSCPGAAGFKVRGERYLRDSIKVSHPPPPCTAIIC